jgi:hypothetical protein
MRQEIITIYSIQRIQRSLAKTQAKYGTGSKSIMIAEARLASSRGTTFVDSQSLRTPNEDFCTHSKLTLDLAKLNKTKTSKLVVSIFKRVLNNILKHIGKSLPSYTLIGNFCPERSRPGNSSL